MERDRRQRPAGVETAGQQFSRVVSGMVTHALAFEATKGDPESTRHLRAKEGLATGRDEFKEAFLKGDGYDDLRVNVFSRIIQIRVDAEQARAKEEVEDREFVAKFQSALAGETATLVDLRQHYGQMSRGFGREVR